jgi:hypothetical protein
MEIGAGDHGTAAAFGITGSARFRHAMSGRTITDRSAPRTRGGQADLLRRPGV